MKDHRLKQTMYTIRFQRQTNHGQGGRPKTVNANILIEAESVLSAIDAFKRLDDIYANDEITHVEKVKTKEND